MERLHNYVLHQNRVVPVWVPPAISPVSLAIILSTFVSIRYTEPPLIFYIVFPHNAFRLMLVDFWLC